MKMRTVTISELASSLESFLQAAKAGETIRVESDDGEPLAELTSALPQETGEPSDWVDTWYEVLKSIPSESIRTTKPTRTTAAFLNRKSRGFLDSETVQRALQEERADRECLPGH
jgi:antitoxin (DNA-binding transcriptional repressor) of toxin-antitoxin stability system